MIDLLCGSLSLEVSQYSETFLWSLGISRKLPLRRSLYPITFLASGLYWQWLRLSRDSPEKCICNNCDLKLRKLWICSPCLERADFNFARRLKIALFYPDDSVKCFPDYLDRAEQLARQEDLVRPFLSRGASWVIKKSFNPK